MARDDIERDLRLALEKCEQMLARLRAPRASDLARDRDAVRVDENTEQLLEDLSPRARLAPPLPVAEVDPSRRAVVLPLEKNALRVAAERWSLEGAELAPPGAEQTTEETNAGEGHLLFVPTTAGYVLVERNGPAPPDGDRVELPQQAASFRVAKLGPSPLPHDARVCAYLDRPR